MLISASFFSQKLLNKRKLALAEIEGLSDFCDLAYKKSVFEKATAYELLSQLSNFLPDFNCADRCFDKDTVKKRITENSHIEKKKLDVFFEVFDIILGIDKLDIQRFEDFIDRKNVFVKEEKENISKQIKSDLFLCFGTAAGIIIIFI